MKQVAPNEEGAIPERTVTIQHGDWRCMKCGQPLSAQQAETRGHWRVGLPAECGTEDDCANQAAMLANSMLDPEHACLPPS